MKRPTIWLPLCIVLLAGGGGWLLAQPQCSGVEPREREYFAAHLYWQTGFDALSAVCGAGLLTRKLDVDYTETGRWVLSALCLAGALLYLGALAATARRIGAAPRVSAVLTALLLLVGLCTAALVLADYRESRAPDWGLALRRSVAVMASGGIFEGEWSDTARMLVGVAAWVSALGWGCWLIVLPSWRATMGTGRIVGLALGYTAFLVLLAGLVFLFESPRGGPGHGSRDDPRGEVAGWSERAADAAALVGSAAGAGVCPDDLRERGLGEETKFVLATAIFSGGLAGGPGGGIRFPVLLVALSAAWAALRPGRLPDPETARWQRGCMGGVLALGGLTLLTALGLLAIEQLTAARFRPAPSVSDALARSLERRRQLAHHGAHRDHHEPQPRQRNRPGRGSISIRHGPADARDARRPHRAAAGALARERAGGDSKNASSSAAI